MCIYVCTYLGEKKDKQLGKERHGELLELIVSHHGQSSLGEREHAAVAE